MRTFHAKRDFLTVFQTFTNITTTSTPLGKLGMFIYFVTDKKILSPNSIFYSVGLLASYRDSIVSLLAIAGEITEQKT